MDKAQLPAQRVGVFIDVQNMYYSAKALYSRKVDFGKVLEIAVANRELVRSYAYVIQAEMDQEQPFFDALRDRGLELRIKELQTFNDGNKKGDWDVGIAMDVVRMANKLDVIVLVSGDGDFAELLKYVKALGCRAEVMAFGQSSSIHIREEADAFVDLSKMIDQVLIRDSRAHILAKAGKKKPNSPRQATSNSAPARSIPARPSQNRTTSSVVSAQKPVPKAPNTNNTGVIDTASDHNSYYKKAASVGERPSLFPPRKPRAPRTK